MSSVYLQITSVLGEAPGRKETSSGTSLPAVEAARSLVGFSRVNIDEKSGDLRASLGSHLDGKRAQLLPEDLADPGSAADKF